MEAANDAPSRRRSTSLAPIGMSDPAAEPGGSSGFMLRGTGGVRIGDYNARLQISCPGTIDQATLLHRRALHLRCSLAVGRGRGGPAEPAAAGRFDWAGAAGGRVLLREPL